MTMNIDIKEVPLAPENPLAFRQRLKAARRLIPARRPSGMPAVR